MQPIIASLLDTDLYKFTMQQVVLHRFSSAEVEYRFKCRTPGIDLRPHVGEIRHQIDAFCTLRVSREELGYLAGMRFFQPDYLDFLANFQPDPAHVRVEKSGDCAGEIEIVVRGPWLNTIPFEVPILAIVNEIYFRHAAPAADFSAGLRRLSAKLALIGADPNVALDFRFGDFGTRRRYSRDWQEQVVGHIASTRPQNFSGSSNLMLARKFGLPALGTMAHEYLQAMQALGPSLKEFQRFAFDVWLQEYRGELGIALSDVIGFEAFLNDFDLSFSQHYDGMRHDSDDPFAWGEKALRHYQRLGIDPRTKTLLFSDSLTMPLAIDLHRRFRGRAATAFGIGTNLTNDLGCQPINIVMKMTECNGQPVAKLSDAPGKTICRDAAYLAHLRKTFGICAVSDASAA
ncbi:MAG: nicotinate phosphoribosyltransferase [Betaproteobacteria bacterium]|nr:nicotinate phosphoribosyltransferase [Betaproteobacteria bacterium]